MYLGQKAQRLCIAHGMLIHKFPSDIHSFSTNTNVWTFPDLVLAFWLGDDSFDFSFMYLFVLCLFQNYAFTIELVSVRVRVVVNKRVHRCDCAAAKVEATLDGNMAKPKRSYYDTYSKTKLQNHLRKCNFQLVGR